MCRSVKKDYQLILFDCFNTLFLTHEPALPRLEVDGRMVTSTAGLLHEALAPRYPDLEPAGIHRAMRETWRWAEAQRGEDCLEIPAPVRMAQLFRVLSLEPDDDLIEALVWVHMDALTACYRMPEDHRTLLEGLRGVVGMAIFSNFDYAPGLHRLLREHAMQDWFDPVIVSDTLGYRKPGRTAFNRAIAMTGKSPESILYVGDSYGDDVRGATGAGLDVAWLNPAGDPVEPDCPPTHVLTRLPELAALVKPG